MPKKVSIITVTKNNANGLNRTLRSIQTQSCEDFECIVVDGNSIDNTELVLNEYKNIIDIIEKDENTGIYSAMNQGIKSSSGEWLVFLNAGDSFSDHNVLCNVKPGSNTDIYHGRVENRVGRELNPRDTRGPIWSEMPFCHQAAFFKRSLFKNRQFDTTYKISADHEFILWANNKGYQFEYTAELIAKIQHGGVSELNIVRRVLETYRAARFYFSDADVHIFFRRKLLWAIKKQIKNLLNSNCDEH
ncbi:glycosyltransferase [Desulfosediminicola flagellatus]|uniref:glycosyltransferase n=1 Tax=Desulfosediminicola flagellatus TaxID=2569541 RepID=UPI0010ACD819|nr:glycosyltransferase [Desulfosediminicola flagellatus]